MFSQKLTLCQTQQQRKYKHHHQQQQQKRRISSLTNKVMSFLVISVVLVEVALVGGLQIEQVTFPEYAMFGQTIKMVCEYTVGQSEFVDSIKWYKDNMEFYRIVPNTPIERDRVVTFPRLGIKLEKEQSGILRSGVHQLVLQDVNLNSSGSYRCQITLSGPPFHTEQRDRNFTVIIRPESKPQMIGLKPEYTPDDVISVTCTSRRSYPASRLDFFINDEPVGESLLSREPVLRYSDGILETSILHLKYPVLSRVPGMHLTSDVLRIKCTAKIGNTYWESVVEKTVLKKQGRMLESRSNMAVSARHLKASDIVINVFCLLISSWLCQIVTLRPQLNGLTC